MAEPGAGSPLVDPEMEADRELLLAAVRRHADRLPTRVLGDLCAAADELVDPLVLPTLFAVDPADTVDLLAVVRAVRARLQAHAESAVGVGPALACARAARQLHTAERELSAGAGW